MANGGGASGGSSKDVRAGGAFVEIFGKDNLTRLLDKSKSRVNAFAGALKSIGTGMGIVGGAIMAPLTAFLVSGVNKAADIDRMAEALGFSREEMQRLAYAAEVAGVSIDEVIDNQERYQDLIKNAPTLDDQTIKDSTTAQREFSKAIIEVRNAITPLISSIVPYIQMAGTLIKNNAGLARTLFIVGAGITGLGIAFVLAGTVISGAITVVTTVIGILGSLAGVLGAIFTPAGLVAVAIVAVVAAVAGGIAAFLLWTDEGRMLAKMMGEFFGQIYDIASTTIGGIIKALTKGEWKQAWEILKAGGIAAFKTIEAWATKCWVGIKIGLVDNFRKGWNECKNLALDFTAFLMRNSPSFMTGGMTAEEINKARDELKAENNADLGKELADAEKFRQKQVAAAEAEMNRAVAKLNQEVAKVNANPGAGMEGFDHPPPAMVHAVRGAFRVMGDARQFGSGNNIGEKQLKQQELANELLQGIKNALADAQIAFK